jgi:succinate dehydrogenase / fumarate reductase cytochrome b subunit
MVRPRNEGVEIMAGPSKAEQRPLSPHLSIWRWHVTMATSIFHRATGFALYVGAAGLALWVMALAAGPEAYQPLADAIAHPLGQLALYLVTVALAYHLANGIRHLAWDVGAGYGAKTVEATGWLVIIASLVAPLGVWALAAF